MEDLIAGRTARTVIIGPTNMWWAASPREVPWFPELAGKSVSARAADRQQSFHVDVPYAAVGEIVDCLARKLADPQAESDGYVKLDIPADEWIGLGPRGQRVIGHWLTDAPDFLPGEPWPTNGIHRTWNIWRDNPHLLLPVRGGMFTNATYFVNELGDPDGLRALAEASLAAMGDVARARSRAFVSMLRDTVAYGSWEMAPPVGEPI